MIKLRAIALWEEKVNSGSKILDYLAYLNKYIIIVNSYDPRRKLKTV